MLDIMNFGIALLTLIFYFNNIIEKFKPCLNIILVSLFIISYSMNNTQYLLGTVMIILLFYFLIPADLTEGFETNSYKFPLTIIDGIDTLPSTPEQRKSIPGGIIKNKKELGKILKTGKWGDSGDKKSITHSDPEKNGIRIVQDIDKPDADNKKFKIFKVKKIEKSFIMVRMGKTQDDDNDPDDDNEEDIVRNKLIEMNQSGADGSGADGSGTNSSGATGADAGGSGAGESSGSGTGDDDTGAAGGQGSGESSGSGTGIDDTMADGGAGDDDMSGGVGGDTFIGKIIEGFKSKKSKKKKSSKKNKKKSKSKTKEYGFNQKFNADESFVNNKETLVDLYKSLDSTSAKGLNSDTKELLDTQKNLMSTLKEMGPVLTQGKDIMNTFNKYFGSNPKV